MKEPIFTQAERSVAELEPNAVNPRTLKEKAFKDLQRSLQKDPHFLKARPIIVSMEPGREGTVIAGNQRLTAAQALGWATVPVVEVRGASEEQEREWMVKDNLHKGEWDFDKLAEGFDLDFLQEMGFDEKELNKVLAHTDSSSDDEFDTEKEAEAIVEPTVQRGEIWQLGEHRLMCGDSTKKEDVEQLMSGRKADMVFTDPPYNYAGKSKNFAADVSKSMNTLANSEWDKDFDIFKVTPILQEFVSQDSTSYIFTSHFVFGDLYSAYRDWADFTSYCVWSKPNPMPSLSKRHWTWNTELCLYATKGKHTFNFGDGHELSCWQQTKKTDGTHPTQKPIELCIVPIQHSSKKSDLILDLFLGSGSTLIACENTGRVCYGMEIDPKYCDVIIKRWEEKTGKKAVKTQV